MVTLHPKAFLVGKVYYWNCRLDGRTALLAGPFVNATLAEECGDYVGLACIEENPETRRATFGVVQMNAPGQELGKYNYLLPAKLQGELLLDTGHRSH